MNEKKSVYFESVLISYTQIISTRSYDERLSTIGHAQDAGISVCSGGIIGLGEQEEDRVGLLHTLSTLPKHPESVPVNALLAVPGTPLEKQEVSRLTLLFFLSSLALYINYEIASICI